MYPQIEPRNNSPISHVKYMEYLPSDVEKFMTQFTPRAIYYKIPPRELADFFSYAFNEKLKAGEFFDITEFKSEISFSNPLYNIKTPVHIYSAKIIVTKSLSICISILKHEVFESSVILMSISDAYKIMSLENDINSIVESALQYWAALGGGEE